MIRYMLVLGLLVVGCTKKGGGDAELTKALAAAPNYKPVCEALKIEIDKVCGAGADCAVKDAAAANNVMNVLDKTPYLQKVDVDLLNQFLSIKEPSKTDVSMGTAIIGRDCWSIMLVKPWKGLLGATKAKVKGLDKSRLQKSFRERVFLMDQNLPNYLKLSLKFVLVKEAVADGLFKMSAEGKQPLVELENKLKAVRASLNQEYGQAFKGAEGQAADPDPEKAKYDPAVVSAIMKKELQAAQVLSGEVNTWITKYLTD